MKYLISGILYDTDDNNDELPKTFMIHSDNPLNDEELEHAVSNLIAEKTGYCHKGFSAEMIDLGDVFFT